MRTRAKTPILFALLMLLVSACTQNGTTTPPDPSVPSTSEAPEPTTEAPDEEATVAVYFVRTAPDRFFIEPEYQSGGDEDADPIEAATTALNLLFAASDPTNPAAPKDPDLSTSVPQGVTLNSITLDEDTLIVDVAGLYGNQGGSAQEATLLSQIAHTATDAAGVPTMMLLFDGEVQESLYGHLDTTQPVTPGVLDLTPVTIVTPAYGATVPVGDVTFSGEALVFEATVLLELVNTDTGASAYSGFTTATTAGPERGTWEFTHTFTQPGTYTLNASESDPSDGEGRQPFTAVRTIVVS
ncbi:MAG: Gmad2 immunoglobulin-like domain-containing protein [Nitriliruptoraceae bacterium]